MVIPQWLLVAVPVVLVLVWLLRSRGRPSRLDPHFLPARLYGPEKHMGFSRLLGHVLLVLVVLVLAWFLLNAEFGGIVLHVSLGK
ncbi:MAG TPA: hypothetical protein VFV38_31170 [Ktedonobacteraceae bacterium]|nr:hypothetical protein [Ktedonobacteraceae bacterium]